MDSETALQEQARNVENVFHHIKEKVAGKPVTARL